MSLRYVKTAIMTQVKLTVGLKFAFALKILSVIIRQGLFVVMWGFFFLKYSTVNGWDFVDMLAMYGMIAFGIGAVEGVFYGLRELPFLIDTNQLDHYLTQPKNILLSVALAKGDISSFSEIFYGLILLFLSGYLQTDLFLFFLLLPLSIIFIFSLHLYIGSMAFYIQNSPGFIREIFQNANIIAGQPNSAYSGFFKIFTLTLLPVGYLSFFPIEFLRTHALANLLISYLGTFVFFLLACRFFYAGLKRYESGSTISNKY